MSRWEIGCAETMYEDAAEDVVRKRCQDVLDSIKSHDSVALFLCARWLVYLLEPPTLGLRLKIFKELFDAYEESKS